MMTRKHFELIARTLRNLRPVPGFDGYTAVLRQWEKAVFTFTDMCAASNPRFNRSRFLEACGVDPF